MGTQLDMRYSSSSQLQQEIVHAIRTHKNSNVFAPVTLLVDQPLQGFLFRRQLAETFAGDELTALGNIQVMTLSELVEGCAELLGVRTEPQPSMQVIEAAIYSLMANSKNSDSESNQSLATASAIAKVFRKLDFVSSQKINELYAHQSLNATQKDVIRYVLEVRSLFEDRLVSDKLLKILSSGVPTEAVSSFGQIHSLVSALPSAIRGLFELLSTSGVSTKHWMPSTIDEHLRPDLHSSQVISCPEPLTEVSVATRGVIQDLAEVRADRIAILAPTLSEYGSQLQGALDEAQITWHGKGRFIGQQSTLFRTLQILVEALAQRRPGHSGFDRPKLMRLLQNGTLSVRGIDIETKYVRKWIRKNSLYDDVAKWIQVIDQLEAEADHENDQISAEHLKHLINYIESDLQALSFVGSWSELGTGLLALTEALHGNQLNLDDDSIEKKGWSSIRKLLLNELPLLDSISLPSAKRMGVPVDRLNLSRWLESQLGSRRVTTGDWSAGIFVGTIDSAKFLKFDSVYVLGATEGLLPAVSKIDPFLPKALLELLGERDLAVKTSEDAAQQTLDVLSSVISGASKIVITRPRAGTSSKLDDVESRYLPQTFRRGDGKTRQHFLEIPSFLASLYSSELGSPLATSPDKSLTNPTMDRDEWQKFSKSMWAWRNPNFNEYFGNLSGLTPSRKIWFPTDLRPLSSSRIDTFLRCPYEFFALTVLGFNSNDKPDLLKSFSPAAFGTFFHREMEYFLKGLKEKDQLPGPGEEWQESAVVAFLKRITAANVVRSFTATGRGGWGTSFGLHFMKVMRGTQYFFATEPSKLRGSPALKIESAEHPFGKPGQDMQVVVQDDGGNTHWIVGQMDRFDLSVDNKAAGVMDFKTGSRTKQLTKLGIGKSARQSKNVYTLQDVIYRKAVLSQHEGASVKVHFVFISEEPEEMYVEAIFANDPNGLLPKKLSEIRESGETGIFVPQSPGSTFDHDYCRVCSSLGDVSDIVKAKYKKSLEKAGLTTEEVEMEAGAQDE
jgi:hypothetical protein